MFIRLSKRIAKHYCKGENSDEKELYVFGINQCLNMILNILTALFIGILFGKVFDTDPRKLFFWGLDSVHEIYTKSHWYDFQLGLSYLNIYNSLLFMVSGVFIFPPLKNCLNFGYCLAVLVLSVQKNNLCQNMEHIGSRHFGSN